MRHIQETTRREVDLSSSYFEDSSRPGFDRNFGLLSLEGHHIYACSYSMVRMVYVFLVGQISHGTCDQHVRPEIKHRNTHLVILTWNRSILSGWPFYVSPAVPLVLVE